MPAQPQPTTAARLATDAATARRIVDLIAESLDAYEAVAGASEDGAGRWIVAIHFRAAPDETAVRALVALAAGASAADALTFETSAPQDWVKASLEGLTPVTAGRFVVHTAHHRAHVPANRIGIEIEASLAFGTGHHASTRGCLLALDRIANRQRARPICSPAPAKRRPKRAARPSPGSVLKRRPPGVRDIGTGTGVLAIAAARALRRPVLASDIDPIAVAIARDNVRRNRAASLVEVVQADGLAARELRRHAFYDLVLANIVLGPLQRLAGPMVRTIAPGARVVLSGLLREQATAAIATYRSHGLLLEQRIPLDGWVTLVLRRAVAAPRSAP